MTDPLSPEELDVYRRELRRGVDMTLQEQVRMVDIAEDHARLVAEVERLKVDGAECDRRTARLRELARENAVLQQHLATTSQAHSDLEDQLADWKRDHAEVMSETCASDEKHCTCVPHLRAENAKLRERVEKLEAAGATVLRGFDEGAFVRDVRGDHDPAWAIKLLPYLAALAALAACDEEKSK